MQRALAILLVVHLVLASALFVTMDMDLDGGALRDTCNALIDGYEFLGLGMLPLGVAMVTLALGVAYWRVRASHATPDEARGL